MAEPRRCDMCVRRCREKGGNESCPVFERRKIAEANGLLVKESIFTAWGRHLDLWPDGCSSFEPGDRRVKLDKAPYGEQLGLLA